MGAASDAKETNAACRPRGKDAPTPEMEWGLKDATRCDVDQADVAALGASLLGMAPPKHNSGVLPVSYLNSARPDIRSGAAVANAAQMLSVYRRKVSVTSSTSIMAYVSPTGFRPYAPLINADETLAGLELAHARGDHATAIEGAQALSLECVWGNAYLHSYDKVLLMGVITACFLSWMAFLGVHLRVERGGVSRVGEASSKTRATAGGGGGFNRDIGRSITAKLAGDVLRVLQPSSLLRVALFHNVTFGFEIKNTTSNREKS